MLTLNPSQVRSLVKQKNPNTAQVSMCSCEQEKLAQLISSQLTVCTKKPGPDLRWKNHISQVCSKANKTLGFLKRNLNIASTTVKRNATSLVRPLVEFACTAWDPYHSTQSHRLEMVQRRAARYVTNRHHNRSSVSDMISHLNWKSLEERRKNARLAMLYKMTNNMVNIDTEERLIPPNRYSRNMHQRSFRVFYHRSDFRKESFFPRTIRDWNALPPAVASAESLGVFKTLLSTV